MLGSSFEAWGGDYITQTCAKKCWDKQMGISAINIILKGEPSGTDGEVSKG